MKGHRVPLIGRICMDRCMIDASEVKNVRPRDEVVLFGGTLHVDEIAARIGTINYEIVCEIGKRVPRIYVE